MRLAFSIDTPEFAASIEPGHPTLVVAEGPLMHLREDRFDCGQLLFDTLSPLARWLSQAFAKGNGASAPMARSTASSTELGANVMGAQIFLPLLCAIGRDSASVESPATVLGCRPQGRM
jgi:hypothetical protein